jgi:hypothetical protein
MSRGSSYVSYHSIKLCLFVLVSVVDLTTRKIIYHNTSYLFLVWTDKCS